MHITRLRPCLSENTGFLKTDLIIMCILAGISFVCCFAITTPGILMNDEWITLNQLYQISHNSQITFNEGKYGTLFTGELDSYFVAKQNYLAYSLFLPVVSLPVLHIIHVTSDNFRLLFLCIWASIGYITLALFRKFFVYNKRDEIISLCLFIIFTALFISNIIFYRPFPAESEIRPVETAAIIFMGSVLFSLMTPLLYGTFIQFLNNRKTAIISSIITLCCSSYLIWAGSAKDHILVAFLVTCIFFLISLIINHQSGVRWFFLFLICGLLCWARTEYGVVVLLGLVGWFVWKNIFPQYVDKRRSLQKIIIAVGWAGGGTLCGLIPFFYNNIITTKNPFIPPQYIYIATRNLPVDQTAEIIESNAITHINSGVFSMIWKVISFYMPDSIDISDLYGIMIDPQNGGVGILFIVPLLLPACGFFFAHRKNIHKNYTVKSQMMIHFAIFFIFISFLAYLRVLHGSNVSFGVLPDMRYYSPLYVPLNIVSILLLSPIISSTTEKVFKIFITAIMCFPISYILIILSLSTQGASFQDFMVPLEYMMIVFGILSIILATISKEYPFSNKTLLYVILILVVIPLTFQIIDTVITGHQKPNGYTYWLPILEFTFGKYFISL